MRNRRSHISCNSPDIPDCISIVHSMSRVIRKLRLPDYAERRDLRSLPGGLIDTDTSGNLKCVRVKEQPPLPSSPTFPGHRENCLSSLSQRERFLIWIAIRFAFLPDEVKKFISMFCNMFCFLGDASMIVATSVRVRLLYRITQYSRTSINRTSITRIFYYPHALLFAHALLYLDNMFP